MFDLFNVLETVKDFFFLVGYVSNYNFFPEPLSIEEERKYLLEYQKGNIDAKKILIERNLRLVAHIARKYINVTNDIEDIISIGTIGLIKGINSYKQDKGVKLGTYAARCIENEILMYFRATKKQQQEISLNQSIGQDKDGNEITFMDILEENNKAIEEQIDLKIKIKKLYAKIGEILKDRERLIIEMRFGLNDKKPKTQNEIAKILGISRSYVSRIETKSIKKLAQEMKNYK